MKAIITFTTPDKAPVTLKGKDIKVYEEGTAYRFRDGKRLLASYQNVDSVVIKGKPKPLTIINQDTQEPPIEGLLRSILRTLSHQTLSDAVAEGLLKAEQLTDERSQARFAAQGHPVATDSNALETFLLSKMTPEDCGDFMECTLKADRDILREKLAIAEKELDVLRGDLEVPNLSQAIQDREKLYGRIVKLQEVLEVQRRPENQTDEYMRGLLNGLILAESIMLDQEPAYAKKQSVLYNSTKPMAILYIESTDFPLPEQPAPPAMPTASQGGDMPAMPPEDATTHIPLSEKKQPRQAWKQSNSKDVEPTAE